MAAISDLHALRAVLNAGELSSNLLRSNPPWLLGSGKLGSPCERMQRATLTSAAILSGDPVVGCPLGASALHAWLAARYAGLLVLKLWGRSIPIPPLVEGSGKFGTPWLRMQREYAKYWASSLLEEADDPGV